MLHITIDIDITLEEWSDKWEGRGIELAEEVCKRVYDIMGTERSIGRNGLFVFDSKGNRFATLTRSIVEEGIVNQKEALDLEGGAV
jgi:hypothetical protein